MVIADCVTFRNVFFSNWGLGILKGYSAEKVVAAVIYLNNAILQKRLSLLLMLKRL